MELKWQCKANSVKSVNIKQWLNEQMYLFHVYAQPLVLISLFLVSSLHNTVCSVVLSEYQKGENECDRAYAYGWKNFFCKEQIYKEEHDFHI